MVTWRSCIASSSADCVFGGVRLISSASTRLAKIGPCRRRNAWVARSKTFVPTTSAGMRSGENWMRLNARVERVRERAGEQRLGGAGHALEQHVAAGEQPDEQAVDRRVLPDDRLRDLGADRLREPRDLAVRQPSVPRPPVSRGASPRAAVDECVLGDRSRARAASRDASSAARAPGVAREPGVERAVPCARARG